MRENLKEKFLEGQLILIDKPIDWTSFDVVNKLKYRLKYDLGLKKIKVGHAGTLDPLATGLLLICTGKKTKSIESLQDLEKVYTGEFMMGATRPSFDRETEINEEFPWEMIDQETLENAASHFIGGYEQNVPIYSAVKIDGVRSYKMARKGEEVKIKKRQVKISRFDIETDKLPLVPFEVAVSKGTYIRALADDFGRYCNSGAYLDSLRRTKIGDYDVNNALSPQSWIDQLHADLKDAKE